MGAAKKVKKAKKITRASQTGTMRQVFAGRKMYTSGGLTKANLMMNARGKVVSKKAHSQGKSRFKKSGLGKWVSAMQKARAELGLTGFVACKKGTEYYNLAKSFY